MTVVIPEGTPSDGMVKVAWAPTIAVPTAPKIATEINAATSIPEIGCYLTSMLSPAADPAAVTDRRMCSKQIFEDYGTITYTIDNLVYVYDVQDPAGLSNKLYAALPTGAKGFLVVGWGLDSETDWAVGAIVDVYPVKMGPRVKQAPEENSKLKVSQKPFVTGRVVSDVAIVA